jgi:hypothetical protein
VRSRPSGLFDTEIEHLLPFYATGRLAAPDIQRVERALEDDPFLRERLDLVYGEQAASVQASEALGQPSAGAANRLLALLCAEPSRSTLRAHVLARARHLLARFAPRRYVELTAVILLIVQAVVIGAFLLRPQATPLPLPWQLVFPDQIHKGCFAIAALASDATLSELAAQLQAAHAVIVDGPKPRGLYLLRFGVDLSAAECDRIISVVGSSKNLIRFIMRTI